MNSRDRTILTGLIVANLLCAPVSWIDDGVTPSWIVYPLVLVVALWRVRQGKGALFVAIAAGVFVVVHLPWTWAALTGAEENPLNRDAPSSPVQWLVTLALVPATTALVAAVLWHRGRREAVPASDLTQPA